MCSPKILPFFSRVPVFIHDSTIETIPLIWFDVKQLIKQTLCGSIYLFKVYYIDHTYSFIYSFKLFCHQVKRRIAQHHCNIFKEDNKVLRLEYGSALSCGREFAGSKLQFAFETSVSEQTLICIPSDSIKLQSGGGHYSGCHNVQNLPYSMARVR